MVVWKSNSRSQIYTCTHMLRGVPTEQRFYPMGPLIGIKTNNLKPSHSGNTYPLRSLLILM